MIIKEDVLAIASICARVFLAIVFMLAFAMSIALIDLTARRAFAGVYQSPQAKVVSGSLR